MVLFLCVISKIIGPSRDRRIISGEEVKLKEICSDQVSREVVLENKKGTEKYIGVSKILFCDFKL